MVGVLRIMETETLAVGATAENIVARDMPWTARIFTSSLVYILVDHEDTNPVATAADFPLFDGEEVYLAIGAGEEISILGLGGGDSDVSVSRVAVSAY